ncbi:MAG: tetratricopeptide repeat protein [Pirellulales bacterium]
MPRKLFSSQIARATLLQAEGDHEAALQSLREAADQARAEFGGDDHRLAVALEQQVTVLRALGRDRQAEDVLQQATRVLMKNMRQSGRALEDQQKYDQAEQLFREALAISEKSYGPDHRETATCLDNLATCLRKQGRYVDAVTSCSRSLAIREAILGRKHAHTATSYCNLGYLYRTLGRYDEAQTLLAQSLAIREQSLGKDHPYVAESLDRLAGLCRDLGRYEEAAHFCERALRIRREALGDDHPLTAASLNNLALSREERIGDAVRPAFAAAADSAAAIDGLLAVPADDSVPSTDGHDSPPLVHKNNGDQSTEAPRSRLIAIRVLAVMLGVAASVATFFLLPSAGMVVAAAVVLVGAASMLGVFSFEAMLLKIGRYAKRVLLRESASARDRVFLGELSDSHDLKLGTDAARHVLTGRHAKALARLDHVDLDHVSALTLAAADELGRQRGTLRLNGIKAVRSKLARPLSDHVGCLQLNGATLVTAAAAGYLCRHSGDIQLNALTDITQEHAEHFAHHTGVLQLNGLQTLTEEAASWLLRHRGRLTLLGLRLVSRQTVRLLRTNPEIQLPSELGEGI